MPPATFRPPVTTGGMASSICLTLSVPTVAATMTAGMATRIACIKSAPMCNQVRLERLPVFTALSAACWMPTVRVRTRMVSTCPAAASGMARAMPVPISCLPAMTRMVEMMEARAASGAMAAPMFIQPSAIISSVPPMTMPVVMSPRTRPVRVQAMSGRCVWNSSRIEPMPARQPTRKTRMICRLEISMRVLR